MSRKPPAHVYAHTVTLRSCSGVNEWQEPTLTEQTVYHVCMQPGFNTILSKDNTEADVSAMLFVDGLYSSPALDWQAIQDESESNGQTATVEFEGRVYTIVSADKLYNEFGAFDHWEVGLR